MELRKNDNDFIGVSTRAFDSVCKLPHNAWWLYMNMLLDVDYVTGTISETDYRGFLSGEKISHCLRKFGTPGYKRAGCGRWDKKKSRRALKTLRYYGFINPVTIDGKQYYEIVNYYLHYYGECLGSWG